MNISTLVIRTSKGKECIYHPDSIFLHGLFPGELDMIPYKSEGIERGHFDCCNPPDLIILKHGSTYHAWNTYAKIKHAWGDKSFILMLNEEAYDVFYDLADFSLSYKPDSHNNAYIIASWLLHKSYIDAHIALMDWHGSQHRSQKIFSPLYEDSVNSSSIRKLIDQGQSTQKTKFCNFIYGRRNTRYPGVVERNKLCQELKKYKQVDCAGRVMNNTHELQELEKQHSRNIAKLIFMSQYKFTIVGENRSSPLYFTEKLIYPLLVGSIPIFCGTKKISELLNPQAFINCNDYESFEKVVERVKEIDNDPDLYAEYVNAPLFLDDSLVYGLSKDNLKIKLRPLITALQKHRSALANQNHLVSSKPYGFIKSKYLYTLKAWWGYFHYKPRKTKAAKLANET